MRRMMLATAFVVAATPLAAQGNDPDHKVAGGGKLPAGWAVRLDRANGKMEDVKFAPMGSGYHVTLGPAAIFYNPAHKATGYYTAMATIAQTKAPAHLEAYGLIVGGRNLDAPNQEYLYFIVRQDGKYMIKHRAGSEVHTIVDWTDHSAIIKADASGKATNTVAIRSTRDSILYLVNNSVVHGQDRAHAGAGITDGQVGLRVNHNLDVHIADFAIVPASGNSPAATRVGKDAKKP